MLILSNASKHKRKEKGINANNGIEFYCCVNVCFMLFKCDGQLNGWGIGANRNLEINGTISFDVSASLNESSNQNIMATKTV